ncbi:MAG: LLM class flavin-dependent oxidoreductase [Alphaproteobacteria bacterium]|nr:LLM class flavin-dependent oxidoreductase [Alphaproteobacteria bacterium]
MAASDWKLSVMMGHGSVKRALQLWRRCDEIGLDVVGAADSQNLMREIYVCLTAVALSTKRARIMSYATNPVTRHPSVTAGAFVAMNELAPGRLMMGIGTGDSALWSMGRKPAKLALLRSYIETVKALCAGDYVTWDGNRFKPAWAHFEPFDLPVYVMCSGPKILRMAAEVADGAVIHMGFAPEDIAHARSIVEEGRRAAGKDPKTFDIWWNAHIVFDESYAAAARRSIGWLPSWLTMGSMDGKGIPDQYKEKLKQLNADTHSLASVYRSKNREEIVVERAKELGLYDWLLSRSPRLFGTTADVAERMNDLKRTLDLKQWIFFAWGKGERTGGEDAERLEMIDRVGLELRPLLA